MNGREKQKNNRKKTIILLRQWLTTFQSNIVLNGDI